MTSCEPDSVLQSGQWQIHHFCMWKNSVAQSIWKGRMGGLIMKMYLHRTLHEIVCNKWGGHDGHFEHSQTISENLSLSKPPFKADFSGFGSQFCL